ncbi:MAG: DUF362 domain-containing protein [Deltaproteobacteria bacterium]|nr:DUF362 domain-containing protein [Deltaproteobacteria bacterium]
MKNEHSRRQFLKAGIATTAAALTGGPASIVGTPRAHASQFPDLVVVHGRRPAENARAAVEALGGMGRFVKPGNKVVIKPNMSFARTPEQASNTNPDVVAEVARLCADAGASRISVLDNVLQAPQDCLSLSKIPAACQAIPRTTVQNIQARRLFREIKVPKGIEFKSMEVIGEVLDADVLIATPVGKSHSSAGVSLSMKGMMGLIYDRVSFHSRHNLHQAVVDMVTVLKPHLVVMDATRILSDGGPGGPGKVIPMDLVIASTDMVAADAQMVALGEWYGKKFKPDQVRHIRLAAEQGLGRMDLEKLNVKSVKI